MKLTGQCKEAFEEWHMKENYSQVSDNLKSKTFIQLHLDLFYGYSFSMQYGVYEDFFDSVGLRIEPIKGAVYWAYYITGESKEFYSDREPIEAEYDGIKNRNEARTKAIEKANEIFNNREE